MVAPLWFIETSILLCKFLTLKVGSLSQASLPFFWQFLDWDILLFIFLGVCF